MRTGMHPMKTRFQLFLNWGITFGEPYTLQERTARKVEYASKEELVKAILEKYSAKKDESVQEIPLTGREGASKRLEGYGNPHGPRTD